MSFHPWQWIKVISTSIGQWFKWRQLLRVIEPAPQSLPDETHVLAAGLVPPPVIPPLSESMNRAERRALRARLKQDKFVTPKGPQPTKRKQRTPVPISKPIALAESPDDMLDNSRLIIDKINDIDEDVLIEETEIYGEFNFRDSILDQLDRYWVYLARMKRHDAGAYGFYKELGATIVPRITTGTHWKHGEHKDRMTAEERAKYKSEIYLPSWFIEHRPAFGCVAYGAHSLSEKHELVKVGTLNRFVPKFLYYIKYDRPPPEVQPKTGGGDVYRMTVWWDRPQDKKMKWGVPLEFAVFISHDGKRIQVLRKLDTKIVHIPKKHSTWKVTNVPKRAWYMPDEYEEWAHYHGLDSATFLAHLFATTAQMIEYTNYSMVRVKITKDNMHAVFGVSIKRMAYFFQDRDFQLTESGTRKRIFHVVRPHIRSDGVKIKMHFRGVRNFEWAGYHVDITVPGLDHFMLPEFDVGVDDEYWWNKKDKDRMEEPEVGKWLAQRIRQGVGGYKR